MLGSKFDKSLDLEGLYALFPYRPLSELVTENNRDQNDDELSSECGSDTNSCSCGEKEPEQNKPSCKPTNSTPQHEVLNENIVLHEYINSTQLPQHEAGAFLWRVPV